MCDCQRRSAVSPRIDRMAPRTTNRLTPIRIEFARFVADDGDLQSVPDL